MSVDLETVPNGFEGLIKLGRRRPHLLLTDLVMPGMDGFQMLAALQILESPMAMSDVVVTAQARLCTKPLSVATLGKLLPERLPGIGGRTGQAL